MLFKAKEQPKFEEDTPKMYGYTAIRKCVLKKEIGENTDECKKIWKDLGIDIIENDG